MNKLININSYQKWCDGIYERGRSLPEGKIIWANLEDVKYLFETIKHYPERKIVLVSAASDYGLHYQIENPINKDIHKNVLALNFKNIEESSEYVKLTLGAANYKECDIKDKFSVKMDRFTENTFNEVPINISKWFCANCNVNEDNIEWVPYGANCDTEENGILAYFKKPSEKTKLVYANFRINSVERLALSRNLINLNLHNKQMLRESDHEGYKWLTYVGENIPTKEYYQEMAEHYYSICAPGNGLDSFRIAESLSIGTLPIVSNSRWAHNALNAGFPVIPVNNLPYIDYDFISLLEKNKGLYWAKWNPEVIREKYWKEKIYEAAK